MGAALPAQLRSEAAGSEAAGSDAPQPSGPYRVLARKYRPRTFDDLIGQEALVRTLRNAFAQGRVHHAFLLTGVRGVGKTTTARIVARALNCVGPDGTGGATADPCGACAECQAILADRHPDVVEMDAASNRGIDDVRELREALRFRPSQGRQKVFILDEVHMLTEQAFNALLKSLEEPPARVTFILATTELRKVPITIRSRCQTFALRRVPLERLRDHFAGIARQEGASVEDEALTMVARGADGSVRDGLSILDQAIALAGPEARVTSSQVREMLGLADRALVMDIFEAVVRADLATALRRMEEAHEVGADPSVIVADLLELTHTLTRLSAVPLLARDLALPEAERARGATLAKQLSVPVLARCWQMLLKGLEEVNAAPDKRLAAEMLLIRLAHVSEQPTPGDILRRLEGMPAGEAPRGNAPSGPRGNASSAAGGGAPPAMRAVANGAPVAEDAAPAVARSAAPTTWPSVVALAHGREPMLHAHLLHDVHPVRLAPGRLEIRVLPKAPRDLAAKLSALLEAQTGARWVVALSHEPGGPTLAEQSRHAEEGRRDAARAHPLVQAILAAFPGATLQEVRDDSLDAYGLPPKPAAEAESDDAAMAEREFAPPDAFPYDPPWDPEEDDTP